MNEIKKKKKAQPCFAQMERNKEGCKTWQKFAKQGYQEVYR